MVSLYAIVSGQGIFRKSLVFVFKQSLLSPPLSIVPPTSPNLFVCSFLHTS